jgi:hypothetical protein
MKKKLTFLMLGLTSISAHYHEPSVTLHVDERYPFSISKFHFSLQHQSTLEIEDGNIIILHALSAPYSHKSFHHEGGVGFRRIYDNFAFGTNFVYANQNSWGFFNHHLVPGIEIFYYDFSLVYNRYLPVKDGVQTKSTKYLFHDVSEVCLSYRPWGKYELSFTSNFNHNTKKFGYEAEIGAYVFDNLKISIVPYCEPKIKSGVAFSLGYAFGGPKNNVTQTLKKSHRFFFTSNLKEVKRLESHIIAPVFIPAPQPVIAKPVKTADSWWERVLLDLNRRA